jgi:hypothetical protein
MSHAQEYQKRAQTGMQFLSVVSDAKAVSMAEAVTTIPMGSSSLFFNPATLSQMQNFIDISGSSNKWIADINHYTFSMAINPLNGEYGVFGFTLQSVNYGDFIGTQKTDDFKGYIDTGIFSLSAMAIGVGYARELSDKFSVGGQVRYVHQDLGESMIPFESTVNDSTLHKVNNKKTPLVFDFGTFYKTGIHSLVFGMSVRNFSTEIKYADEPFQAPLVFNLGISMDMMDFIDDVPFDQKLFLSIDANHHQDKNEQLKFGVDYQLLNLMALRTGYITGEDLNGFSFGFGITKSGFSFDYSYTPFDLFEQVQRLTGRITF